MDYLAMYRKILAHDGDYFAAGYSHSEIADFYENAPVGVISKLNEFNKFTELLDSVSVLKVDKA